MSEGLESLHHPRIELAKIDISAEGKQDIAYMPFYKTKQYAAIEKELKALEIIKKKKVDCGYLTYLIEIDEKNALRLYNQDVENNPYGFFDELLYDCRLTQEEYELLKEELL